MREFADVIRDILDDIDGEVHVSEVAEKAYAEADDAEVFAWLYEAAPTYVSAVINNRQDHS